MTVIVKNRNLGIEETHGAELKRKTVGVGWYFYTFYNTNACLTKQARSATETNFIELTCSLKEKMLSGLLLMHF